MKLKKFARFICNTAQHPRGEKVKILKTIAKVFDDQDNFLYIRKPYIRALTDQFEIDIEIIDGKFDCQKYSLLHHFKADNGNIIKRTDSEIETIEADIASARQIKEIERQERELAKLNLEATIKDDSKTDAEKLDALIKLYKGV